jgi:putative ABC transport system ATP-binding protein
MKEAHLELQSVSKSWTAAGIRLPILRDVNLRIARGEALAITGPSGSGKSTLLHLLAGLTPPDHGTLAYRGINLQTRRHYRQLRLDSGFVFQDGKLIEGLNILENTCVPLVHRRVHPRVQAHCGIAALEEVGLGARRLHYPRQLSGGELIRAAIARAMVSSPQIVFADEPTGNLDADTADAVAELLLGRLRQGMTLVLVTHSNSLARRMHRQIRLSDGGLYEND